MENTEEKKAIPPKAPPRPPQRPLPPKPVRPQKREQTEINEVAIEENQEMSIGNVETANQKMVNDSQKKIKTKKVQQEKEQKTFLDKKEKDLKAREIKQPKAKKKLSKKIKILIIIIAILLVIGMGGGIAAGVLINKANNVKLLTPEIEVVQLYNGTILQTAPQSGATSYEFVITDPSGKQSTIKYSSNRLELNNYFNQAGRFSVKIRVLGKGSGATSDFSEVVQFENKVQLASPVVHVNNTDKIIESGVVVGYKNNTDISDDTLTWDPIKNASKYYVRYGVDASTNTVKYIEVDANSDSVSLPLSQIYAKGTGRYQISVIAVAEDGSFYLNSDYQEVINIEYYAKQDSVYDLAYNQNTKILSFKINESSNYGNEFDLLITYTNETKQHKIYLDQSYVTKTGGVLTISCNLEQIASGDILSLSVVTLSDGEYSTDSESVDLSKDDFS